MKLLDAIKLAGLVTTKDSRTPVLGMVEIDHKMQWVRGFDLDMELSVKFTDYMTESHIGDPKRLTNAILAGVDLDTVSGDYIMPDFHVGGERVSEVVLLEKELRVALKNVSYAQGKKDVRYYLNGVFFDGEKGCLVATDGHRLARYHMPEVLGGGSATIPLKAIKILEKLLCNVGRVTIQVYEKYTVFSNNDWILKTKNINGRYPDYPRLIPSDGDYISAPIFKSHLPMLKNLLPLLNSEYVTVQAKISEHTGIAFSVPEKGGDYYYNAKYLIDLIKASGEGVIQFRKGGSLLYKSSKITAVIMPIRF